MNHTDSLRRRVLVGGCEAAIFCLIGFIFLAHTLRFPPCCDVVTYLEIARQYAEGGLLTRTDLSDLRTYAYPTFLRFLMALPGSAALPIKIAVVQMLLYFIAVMSLRASLRPHISAAANILATRCLLFNPFVFVYLRDPLTEGLSLGLGVLLAAIFIGAVEKFRLGRVQVLRALAIGLLLGLLLAIRPAHISLVGVGIVSLTLFSVLPGRRLSVVLAQLLVIAVGFALPLLPQLAINLTLFDRWTIFPVYDLGGLQIDHGIRVLKFGALMNPPGPRGLFFSNPFLGAVEATLPIGSLGLSWYLANPIAGVLTVIGHVINALSYEQLFVYVYEEFPWYQFPVLVMSGMGTVGGGFMMGAETWATLRNVAARRALTPRDVLVLSAATTICIVLGMCALVNVETRFGLFPQLILYSSGLVWWCNCLRNTNGVVLHHRLAAALILVSAHLLFGLWMLSLVR